MQGKAKGELPKGDALANHLESATVAVRNAYSECPSYDLLIPALLQHGTTDLLTHVHFVAGTPVKAMLAKPTNGVSEVLDRFADCEFTCEYKYDGERAQVRLLPRAACALTCSAEQSRCAAMSGACAGLAWCCHGKPPLSAGSCRRRTVFKVCATEEAVPACGCACSTVASHPPCMYDLQVYAHCDADVAYPTSSCAAGARARGRLGADLQPQP